jgi:transcriptional regulator with XRE-family HTH domain
MPKRPPAKKDPANPPQVKAGARALATRSVLAANVLARLEAKKMTQRDLAERTGLSVSYISMIVRALREPTLTTLHALAEGLSLGARAHLLLARPVKPMPPAEEPPAAAVQ